MIGNKLGHQLKCVKLLGKCIEKNEILNMLRRSSVAILLKVLCKNLCKVKCYDKTNMEVFALSQWENFSWGLGLTYFDQFYYKYSLSIYRSNVCSLR